MTRFLVATDSVHTTATACDYLQGRLDADDEVVVVAVSERENEESGRDAADAANVARVRLADTDVVVDSREGKPGPEIETAVEAHDADELVVGARSGEPGVESGTERRVGSTVDYLVTNATVPVVVVPLQRL